MKSYKTQIAVSLLLLVNFFFVYKYVSRISSYSLLISLSFIAFQFLCIKYYKRLNVAKYASAIIPYLLSLGLLGLLTYTYFYIDIASINVDRHSVISSFIETALKGDYPYLAESHRGNYPGPMPFYFLIALPFYALGELSVLSVSGYLLMIWFITKEHRKDTILLLLFILGSSAFMYWEVVTRSNVFTYSALVALALWRYQDQEKHQKISQLIITGILLGLLLSTRSVYIIPYIVFFVSDFIRGHVDLKEQIVIIAVAFFAFITTFLPLIILYGDQFFVMNPFVIQSSFLIPTHYIILFILISIAFSFLVRSAEDHFFYSGLSLFAAIAIYFLYHIFQSGFQEAYFGSIADISYFILCIPFFLIYLMKNNSAKSTAAYV